MPQDRQYYRFSNPVRDEFRVDATPPREKKKTTVSTVFLNGKVSVCTVNTKVWELAMEHAHHDALRIEVHNTQSVTVHPDRNWRK